MNNIKKGWSAIQEAIASGNRELLSFLIKQTKTVLDQKFEQRIPHAISALSTVSFKQEFHI